MKNSCLISLLLISGAVQANTTSYLDPKTAFCFSDESLGKYLAYAQARNITGLNKLVLAGECNFVPDGDYMQLGSYQEDKIGSMPVVSFELDRVTLWTFKKFVQNIDFN